MGTSNGRTDSHDHPEATIALKIDEWTSVAAHACDDHVRRLVLQVFDLLEINGQQRLKHHSLPLSQQRL